jgi:hypothetical protein
MICCECELYVSKLEIFLLLTALLMSRIHLFPLRSRGDHTALMTRFRWQTTWFVVLINTHLSSSRFFFCLFFVDDFWFISLKRAILILWMFLSLDLNISPMCLFSLNSAISISNISLSRFRMGIQNYLIPLFFISIFENTFFKVLSYFNYTQTFYTFYTFF